MAATDDDAMKTVLIYVHQLSDYQHAIVGCPYQLSVCLENRLFSLLLEEEALQGEDGCAVRNCQTSLTGLGGRVAECRKGNATTLLFRPLSTAAAASLYSFLLCNNRKSSGRGHSSSK